MFGISRIFKGDNSDRPLTEEEIFETIISDKTDPKVLDYLSERLFGLTVEIGSDHEGKVLELMQRGLLEGWCWQTTESSIVFFNDDDYIERGNLRLEQHKIYYHSWICFKFMDDEYVFDPCLDLLCSKEMYSKIFEVNVTGRVTAKEVRDELIYRVGNRKERKSSYDRYLSEETLKRLQQETHVIGNDDVNSPMYRNNTGYIIECENNKIKKLVAHYYFNG